MLSTADGIVSPALLWNQSLSVEHSTCLGGADTHTHTHTHTHTRLGGADRQTDRHTHTHTHTLLWISYE